VTVVRCCRNDRGRSNRPRRCRLARKSRLSSEGDRTRGSAPVRDRFRGVGRSVLHRLAGQTTAPGRRVDGLYVPARTASTTGRIADNALLMLTPTDPDELPDGLEIRVIERRARVVDTRRVPPRGKSRRPNARIPSVWPSAPHVTGPRHALRGGRVGYGLSRRKASPFTAGIRAVAR